MTSNSQGQHLLHGSQRLRKNGAWSAALGIVFLAVFLPASALAAVFTVNTNIDLADANPGDGVCDVAPPTRACTLRAAIQEANALPGTDEIILTPNTYLLNIVTDLDITGSLTITGGGASSTVIDGNRNARFGRGVLAIGSGITVSISGVTIRNGEVETGGGIANQGTLTLTNSTVSGNSASFFGGGIYNNGTMRVENSTVSGNGTKEGGGIADEGGGIYNSGTMTLTNSTVSGNRAFMFAGGGGISNQGTLTLTNSTVSGNSAGYAGGILNNARAILTVINSTVSGNSASGDIVFGTPLSHSGGIFNEGALALFNTTVSDNHTDTDGGGITNRNTLTIINSTVSGNSAFIDGGGIHNENIFTIINSTVSGNSVGFNGGGIFNDGTANLVNSTVSGNSVGISGGGIFNGGTANLFNSTITDNRADADLNGDGVGGGVFNLSGIVNFQNTIIAGNFETVFEPFVGMQRFVFRDCAGTLSSTGNNLMRVVNCTINGGIAPIVANPLLGPLQSNGGPTQAHALLAGSPAIDGGNPGGCRDNLGALLTTDQRGFPRPAVGCDIGAYELFTGSNTGVVAAILPGSRSVQLGTPATAFATMINTGQGVAAGCSIAPLANVAADFYYQTTNPTTNQVTGFPDTAANIEAGAAQSFIFAVTPIAPIAPTDVQFSFDCANTDPAPINTGLNTLLLSASATPVPDIVALAATPPPDPGIVNIPGTNGTGAFAVATVNVGASASITAAADTGSATLPVVINLCETNPANGHCISGIAASVTTQINANATPTFGIFVQGGGNVPFDAAANRVFVRFRDSGGVTRGSTSVAVRTQ
jgi:CSLREA domain-containing protein